MGFFGSWFGRKQPAPPLPLLMRDTLFGDYPLDKVPPTESAGEKFPWSVFVAARERLTAGDRAGAVAGWRQLADDATLEPRLRLQAWHFLRTQGEVPPPEVARQVWGVVVEVGMPKGLDLLAAYPDHTARYYNFSSAGIIWEAVDPVVDKAIDELLDFAGKVAADEQPAKQRAQSPPVAGDVRVSFLTPGGICYETASMEETQRNPVGRVLMHLALNLMKTLIAKHEAQGRSS